MNSIEFNEKTEANGNLIRLRTLCHADKEKMDSRILNLVTLLHQLISGVRRRDQGLKRFPFQSPSRKIMTLQPAVKKLPSTNDKTLEVELLGEDHILLERINEKSLPGVGKREGFSKNASHKTIMSRKWSCSVENSPYRDQRTHCQSFLEMATCIS